MGFCGQASPSSEMQLLFQGVVVWNSFFCGLAELHLDGSLYPKPPDKQQAHQCLQPSEPEVHCFREAQN